MQEYVLLTRSEYENLRLKNKILSNNNISLIPYTYPIVNLTDISFEFIWDSLSDYEYAIITSKFAALVSSQKIVHPIKVFVVGERSAEILRRNSNIKVLKIFFCVDELIAYLLPIIDVAKNIQTKKFIYLCGDIISKDISKNINRVIIYKTSYNHCFSDDLLKKIQEKRIRSILIYSQNTAKAFVDICLKHDVLQYVQEVSIITLSKKIKNVMKKYFCNITHCLSPSEKLMIEMLYDK